MRRLTMVPSLTKAIREGQDELDREVMDNLVENILTSIAAIIKAEGENVKH